jgi:ankyrin repeat protein
MSDILPLTVFTLEINGDALPFTLRAAVGEYGACMNDWVSVDDMEFYSGFLSNLRQGTVLCKIGDKDVLYMKFTEIIEYLHSYRLRPMELTLALRKSKWLLVKENLEWIRTVLKLKGAGVTSEERAQKLRDSIEYLKAAKMGNLGHIRTYMKIINRDFCDNLGWTALHYAVGSGSTDTVKLLLQKNVDVYTTEKNGMTALHLGAFHGQIECVKLLLNYRSSEFLADVTDVFGRSAVHICAICGNLTLMKTFKSMGVDIFKRDKKYGWTPLHYAVHNIHYDVVSFLFSSGAKVYEQTLTEQTVLQISKATNNKKMINLVQNCCREQEIHRIMTSGADAWLGTVGCEVWVGNKNSCTDEIASTCNITCIISLMSDRSLARAPLKWLRESESVEHHHFACSDSDDRNSWRVMLPMLPKFANLLSSKLYGGHKVLVHCHHGRSVSPAAVLSAFIFKRGKKIDESKSISPFFRIEEMIKLYEERHPQPAISDTFITCLQHLQNRLDKNRIMKAKTRVDCLLRVI